jgi:hypothetical protein
MVGRVNGGEIVGTLRKAGRDLANWSAQRKS